MRSSLIVLPSACKLIPPNVSLPTNCFLHVPSWYTKIAGSFESGKFAMHRFDTLLTNFVFWNFTASALRWLLIRVHNGILP